MTTQFCFEHVFRAPSIAAVFDAYFDPAHALHQDKLLDIVERTVIELADNRDTLRRTCKVIPRRQLPAIVRPFITHPLHYIETATWRRADDQIDIEIRPSILRSSGGKPTITARYGLARLPDGSIRRRYEGTVSVHIALIASKIERGIVAEFERSMPIAAASTQDWLDRSVQENRSSTARA